MESRNIYKVKTLLKQILRDLYSDALTDPQATLLDIPFELLELITERITDEDRAMLKEDLSHQDIAEVVVVAERYLREVQNNIKLFRKDVIKKKAERYFQDLGIDAHSENGSRDFSDLMRIIEGNMGNFFNPSLTPVRVFLTGDIMERYFDKCLEDFKANRDLEFSELFKKRAS